MDPIITGFLSSLAGDIANLALLFLPGAWICFSPLFRAYPFWARLSLATLLSPLVVFVAFFPVRWAGIPFGTTCRLLAAVNLPAIWLTMGGPVALVLEPGHGNLLALLKRGRAGKAVYEQGGFVIWLFSPDEKPVFAE